MGIIICWRPQPSREPAFNFVYNWYSHNYPDCKIYLSDKPGEFWSMSGSRNQGVRMAEEDGCDVVIIGDADTFPEVQCLNEAISAAINDSLVHNPYQDALGYDEEFSKKILSGEDPLLNLPHEVHKSTGGIYVCKPSSWWALGGSDEKFVGWGYEDSAFALVHGVIHKTDIVKHPGNIHMLYHERTEGIEKPNQNVINNFNLWRRYVEITTPEKMLELVKIESWKP